MQCVEYQCLEPWPCKLRTDLEMHAREPRNKTRFLRCRNCFVIWTGQMSCLLAPIIANSAPSPEFCLAACV